MKPMKPPKWATTRAAELIKQPAKLREVLEKTERKAEKQRERASRDEGAEGRGNRRRSRASGNSGGGRGGPFDELWELLKDLFDLVRASLRGSYKPETKNLIIIVAGLLYFLNPFDLVFDYLPFFGYVDDAAVLWWVAKACKDEIDRFREWRQSQGG